MYVTMLLVLRANSASWMLIIVLIAYVGGGSAIYSTLQFVVAMETLKRLFPSCGSV